MNALFGLIYAMAATTALIGAAEQARFNHLIEASRRIEPLDSKKEVRDVLGPPLAEWEKTGFIFASGPPQWAYGPVFEPRYIVNAEFPLPLPLPIKIRLFGPNESDLVITWDKNGQVASVTRPAHP
jgi:hypothetical protein